MMLTDQDQQAIARRATWYFDCHFGMTTDDSVIFTGDGVDDLDALISRIEAAIANRAVGRNSRFQVDVGTQYASFKPFDLEDVRAIRSHYIQLYGNVNKPAVHVRGSLIAGSAGIAV